MTNKTVTMSRELAEITEKALMKCGVWDVAEELRALLAADSADYPECSGTPESCPENEGYGCCKPRAPVGERQEPVVIDLDAVDWETIQQAADESNWMPNEYMRNDWVADVCNFLKYGRAGQPAPVAVVLPEPFDMNTYRGAKGATLAEGWNARLDKVKELNQ